jgi:alpha-1,3-glucosyltransferase
MCSMYCYKRLTSKIGKFLLRRFVLLGATVLSVFAFSFGPFAHQLPQVLSRLFPFKRGLCHSYWAPNVWALYSFADRILIKALPRLGVLTHVAKGSLTRGLVGDSEFSVLPAVAPWHTMALTLVTQLVKLSSCIPLQTLTLL